MRGQRRRPPSSSPPGSPAYLPSMSFRLPRVRATTILSVRRDGRVALGGDGQVTVGETVMKSNAPKVRAIRGGRILAGFAGTVADALTLFDQFERSEERR